MPEIFINGQPVQAEADQTVFQVALANGFYIPYFCWHPALSVAGNCRICSVEEEGRGLDISCNMPVKGGMRILTESPDVLAHRKAVMQLLTLNHPVDCGICDKAGECLLQDYHYAHNGSPSISSEPKVRETKFFNLSGRIVLDNERCILCSRCVRFTREISKSNALGIVQRGDHAMVRPAEDAHFDQDHYSDNVIDICPVGALLSKSFFYKTRVWYMDATPSVCPGCERGCTVNFWHRKPEWKLNALDPAENTALVRVTPLENPAVNGHWICNKGRDIGGLFNRRRADSALLKGRPATLAEATGAARALIAASQRRVALVSNWGSNEELAAFKAALGGLFTTFVKHDHLPQPGEPLEDGLLIRPDKNPNTAGAVALFGDAAPELPPGTDLVLAWGEGFDFGRVPQGAKVIFLNAWLQPENGHADVFLPISAQTERHGHYTNFAGVVSAFQPCFDRLPGAADAVALFAGLAAPAGGAA